MIVITAYPLVNIGKLMTMKKTPAAIRERTAFGQRALAARTWAGMTQMQVVKAVDIKQSTLADIEKKATASGYTARLANLYGVDALWLATGEPSSTAQMTPPHAGEGLAIYSVAQNSSLPAGSHQLLEITWESLMGNVPTSLFLLPLRDDALAPTHPRGQMIVWSRTRLPRPGRLALVRDQHGQHHARVIHQGKAPGQLIAAAINPSFNSFDSHTDELTLIAVQQGILDPADD